MGSHVICFLHRSFCYFYDLQEQSTKVFADIICSLHFFIQNQLQPNMSASLANVNAGGAGTHQLNPDGSVMTDSGTGGSSSVGGNIFREGFLFSGTTHAVLALPPVGTARCMLLQMLDKVDSPQVSCCPCQVVFSSLYSEEVIAEWPVHSSMWKDNSLFGLDSWS